MWLLAFIPSMVRGVSIKQTTPKGLIICTLWFQLYDIVEKAILWRWFVVVFKGSGCQRLVRREGWLKGARRLWETVKLLCVIPSRSVLVIIYLSRPLEYQQLNVIHGRWRIMMCQCRSIRCDTCPILMGDVDGGGSWWAVEGGTQRYLENIHTLC